MFNLNSCPVHNFGGYSTRKEQYLLQLLFCCLNSSGFKQSSTGIGSDTENDHHNQNTNPRHFSRGCRFCRCHLLAETSNAGLICVSLLSLVSKVQKNTLSKTRSRNSFSSLWPCSRNIVSEANKFGSYLRSAVISFRTTEIIHTGIQTQDNFPRLWCLLI